MDHIVSNCVIRYVYDGDDRKSFSLVCREWYELDSLTREELTVQLFYATTLSSRLSKRFPFIKTLTLKGLKYFRALDEPLLDITVWMKELVLSFDYLENLDLRYVQVEDENLELLAKTRGKQLRSLMIYKCDKFSTDGLKLICHHCINLITLFLGSNQIIIKDAEWLHELALHNTCIEYLIFFYQVIEFDVNDLTLLAKNCSQSLKHVQITSKFSTVDLRDFFNSAVMLENFLGFRHGAKTEDYAGFKYPPNMKYMWFERHTLKDELGLIVPFAHQLIQLGLSDVKQDDQCFLLEKCPNLESLYISSVHGYNILQLLARICKNLKVIEIYHSECVSDKGLITLAKGCLQLEQIHIRLEDISEEALGCVGAHLKNLRRFHLTSRAVNKRTLIPAEGIRALLTGCTKLEKLRFNFVHRRLTCLGMEYIGKYGHELRHLSLSFTGKPGLKKLRKGCPKLQTLRIMDSKFSKGKVINFLFNNITSLRYIYIWNEKEQQYLTKTRRDFEQMLL